MDSEHYFVLGLDIGIGSCGWAVLDTAGRTVVDMGVRLWDPPQEPKTKVSTATTRRNARSARRNTQRTANRKKHCIALMKNEGLMPDEATAAWLQTTSGEKPTLKLRVRALDCLLSDREWAQVLYSICGRRGYIPHGEGSDDIDGKRVLGAIADNEELMKSQNWRTVGELLSHKPRSRNKGGDYSLCVSNSQLIDEVNVLFAAQEHLGSEHASKAFKDRYIECMEWQKDVTGNDEKIYGQVGYCTYFPTEKRAANACLSSELCKAYERIGHTVIVKPDGKEMPLPPEIRKRAIETWFSPVSIKKNAECKVRYSDLRTWLDLEADAFFKGIEKDHENKEEPYEPKCWRSQRKVLPTDLLVKMRNDRSFADAIDGALTYSSSIDGLVEKLDGLDLSTSEIAALSNLSFNSHMYSGYGARSLKALNLLLDSFEDEEESIVTLTDAESSSGLLQLRLSDTSIRGTQLPPYRLYDETNNNPVVLRVMGQVRKVVNAIIREYGVPDEIHIELARELKRSKKEKIQIHTSNKQREEIRNALLTKLAEELGLDKQAVSLKILRKVELWNEQDGIDLYRNQPIHYDKLIHDETYCQIDHILPYSRTCDDSQMNKILCLNKSNQDKKERTPYEWLSAEADWDDFKLRILRLEHYPYKKKQRLLNTDLAERESEFIERNLNDTRYASREAKSYIETYLEFPNNGRKRHVVAVAGGATAALRNAWQIEKSREEDNLHHAVDAAVIAACNESAVIAIAHASEQKAFTPKAKHSELFHRTQPWEGFAEQVQEFKKRIIPTRMVDHKISGKVFDATKYRFVGLNDDGTKGVLSTKNGPKISSNYHLCEDGSAYLIGGLAFLRLWWDPEARVRGRSDRPGKFIAEPVYFADIPRILDGTYRPLVAPSSSSKKPRIDWDCIPENLLRQNPIILYRNDALYIDGVIRRFSGFDIDGNSWTLDDPINVMTAKEATKGLSLLTLDANSIFYKIEEDILGHCYRELKQ